MRTVWLLGILVLLSGCVADVEEISAVTPVDTAALPSAAPPDLPDTSPRPWSVGDWWTYRYTPGLVGLEAFDITLVVAEERGDSWTLSALDTPHVNETFFTHVPALGPVRKSDFAVTRHGHQVPYLKFPLVEGLTWDVEVRGLWTATAARIDDGWRIEYRQGESLQHVIEWSSEANWITYEAAHFGDETPRHAIQLTAWGSDRPGPFTVYEASDVHVKGHFFDPTQPASAAGSEPFTVGAGGKALMLGTFIGGTDGTCGYAFMGPAGRTDSRARAGACAPSRLEWEVRSVVEGTWTFEWTVTGEGSFIFAEALMLHARPANA